MEDEIEHALLQDLAQAGVAARGYAVSPERLTGGYDTSVYKFRLRDAKPPFDRHLVLRLYPDSADDRRAVVEGRVQQILSSAGYPAPPVHLIRPRPSALHRPFIIMEWMGGDTLISLPEPRASFIMGEVHARLHRLDANHVLQTLRQYDAGDLLLDDRLRWLTSVASPRLKSVVDWLIDRRPNERSLAVCHGDFHKLNILANPETHQVSAVLDWSNVSIMEPAFDVASTLLSFEIVGKHLTAEGDFEPADLDQVLDDYLTGYERIAPLDRTNMPWYRVLRAVAMLILGEYGVAVFRHPGIVWDLTALVEHDTGLVLATPTA